MGGEYQGALINFVKSGALKEKRPRVLIFQCWEPQIIDREMNSLIQLWTTSPEKLKKSDW